MGHKGILKSGDLQWMTAGKGIVHSEMPGHVDTRGLQVCMLILLYIFQIYHNSKIINSN